MMKKVIITGATGFVGANLTRRLLNNGHEVHLLVRSQYKLWRIEEVKEDLQIHVIDLLDSEALNKIITQIKPDWVFHLAVHGAYSDQTDLNTIVQTNILGTINLVQACLKTDFEAFINTGSSSEYGYKDHAPHEKEWLDPNSYYAVTKASATQFCRYTAQNYQVPISTLRLYSVYGSYEEPTRLMPTLIKKGLQGEFPPLVNPEIARDYIYIDDVIDAYLLTCTTPDQELGAVYNVGTGIQTTLRQVVKVAQKVLEIPAKPEWGSMPDRHWDTNVWVSNPERIKNALNWQPRYTFEAGFKAMVEWYKTCKYSAISRQP